jgi:hypothetical protein
VILLGLAILAIGIGDLAVGGLAGEIENARAAAKATLVALAVAATGFCLIGCHDPWAAFVLHATVAVAALAWSMLRLPTGKWKRPWLAIGALVLPMGLLAATSGLWDAGYSPRASKWLASLPFTAASNLGLDRFVLIAGTCVGLIATANAVVRCVLTAAGTHVERSETRLRGGRLIGPLERVMIFALALTGEPTAAALVVSAKSLLRFPEISKAADRAGQPLRGADGLTIDRFELEPLESDSITEYFLIGSLTSWIVALSPTVFLR